MIRIYETLPAEIWQSLAVTLKLAFISIFILFFIGLFIAYWMNKSDCIIVPVIQVFLNIPLVLPPTVIGFYLLILFSPQNFLGNLWYSLFGSTLSFSFTGLVIGSIIYNLPFAVQPFQAALRSVSQEYIDGSFALGASKWQTFWRIELPCAAKGILVGLILCFAHTMGEFGVVLMIGGSIPSETKVAAISLYEQVQLLNYRNAHIFAFILASLSFSLLITMILLQDKRKQSLLRN